MYHRLSQVFCCSLAAVVPLGDVTCCPVIGNNIGMIHRDVSGALLEISHGVTARLHHFFHHAVGFADRATGFINEARLRFLPAANMTEVFRGFFNKQ